MIRRLQGPDGPLRVGRTTGGVLEVRADTEAGRAFGLGWGHARDRALQLTVLRIAGEGRAAELLQGTDGLVAQDRFVRSRGFARAAERQALTLTQGCRRIAEAYADGVNRWFESHPRPLELAALAVDPAPWTPRDSLLIALLQSYLGLAQSQEVVERFLVQVGRSNHPEDLAAVRAVFAPHLDRWDPSLCADVELPPLELPVDPACALAFQAPMGSNAWAVPPGRSASGSALVVGEPHLDTTWLPPSFFEAVLLGPDTVQAGITVPGVPGVIAGRWTHIAAAVTYGFMDQIDHFVEEVDGGRVRRGADWVPLERIEERIERRGGAPETQVLWRSDLGFLQGDADGPPKKLLALRWALDGEGLDDVFALPFALERARGVDEARRILARFPQSFQYALADRDGRTGLQQSGRAPRRAPGQSGLTPEPAWDAARRWGDPVPTEALFGWTQEPTSTEVLATANETTNPVGAVVVNLGLSPDRRDRILAVLDDGPVDAGAIRAVQTDRTSRWARRALAVVAPHLPPGGAGDALRSWDGTYRGDDRAPTLWERLEATWLLAVWGPLFDRARAVCPMPTEDPGLTPHHPADAPVIWSQANSVTTNVPGFRGALLDPEHPVFAGRDWTRLLTGAIGSAFSAPARPWGEANRVRRAWFLLAGNRLSRAPVTSAPQPLPGTLDTPEQGRIHRIGGRVATVAPVWRMVADLSEDALHTALRGGPSDRLLDVRRGTDLRMFRSYRTKRLDW